METKTREEFRKIMESLSEQELKYLEKRYLSINKLDFIDFEKMNDWLYNKWVKSEEIDNG